MKNIKVKGLFEVNATSGNINVNYIKVNYYHDEDAFYPHLVQFQNGLQVGFVFFFFYSYQNLIFFFFKF